MAERVGFEPTVPVLPGHSLSRRALSTAQTPLRGSITRLSEALMSLNRLGVYEGCQLAVNHDGERSENSSAVLNGGGLARSTVENMLQSTALEVDEEEGFGGECEHGDEPAVAVTCPGLDIHAEGGAGK